MAGGAPLVVLGTSKFATEIADFASDCPAFELVAFVENLERDRCEGTLDGLPIVWIDDAAELAPTHLAVCGLGTTKRYRYTDQAEALGFRFATVVHPAAHVSSKTRLGEGTVVAPGAVIGSHSTLGRHVLVNKGAIVGHHTELGDFASVHTGARIAGSCRVGTRTFVGMGAVVIDHRTVGSRTVVGAGAVVTQDLPDEVLVVGVPARVVEEGVEPP
jgi:sugar O-acyltransferase (sialic acid O-acetyltransferase NeuD family)